MDVLVSHNRHFFKIFEEVPLHPLTSEELHPWFLDVYKFLLSTYSVCLKINVYYLAL